jgi:NADH-quinone oxidoreductase subunit A
MQSVALPIFLFLVCATALAGGLLVVAKFLNPDRAGHVKRMPYESGMDPVHDTRRRFDVRFHLLAIAFLVFDVELLFLYPWAVASHPSPVAASAADRGGSTQGVDMAVAAGWVENRHLVFAGAMVFVILLTLGYVYDWRKGVFRWR